MTTKIRPEQAEAMGGCAPCQFAPVAGAGDGGKGTKVGAKSVIVVDPNKSAWIGIALVDRDKKPVPHQFFVVTLPDGQPVRGNLDDNGKARIEGIDPGECQVSFPALDRREIT